MREEGLLKLFFADALPPRGGGRDRCARCATTGVASWPRGCAAMEPKAEEKDDPFPLMVLRGGIEFTEWFADWCERMEAQTPRPPPSRERSS